MGVQKMFLILGTVSTVLMILASLILANPPEGYKPEGFVPVKKAEVSGKDYTPFGMLSTVRFWMLFLVYACGAFGGLMVTSQLSKIATEMTGLTPIVAAFLVSILAISNTCGRFLWGWVASAALSVMEKHKPRPVTVLPVIDENKIPVGIIHLTDLLRQGVV